MGKCIKSAEKRFHIAKLALSHVRFLTKLQSEIEASPNSSVANLYKSTMMRSGHDENNIPSLINQSTFHSMTYICLVWLRESFPEDTYNKICGKFEIGDFDNVMKCGPRPLSNAGQYLRFMRNAVSHADIEFGDDKVVMSDRDRRTENEETSISMDWSTLEKICGKMIFSTNDVLYGGKKQ